MTWRDWIMIVEGPVLLVLFRLMWACWTKAVAAHAELAAYKLQAAEHYATIGYLKDVETRLVGQLDRIADKLDRLIEQNNRRTPPK